MLRILLLTGILLVSGISVAHAERNCKIDFQNSIGSTLSAKAWSTYSEVKSVTFANNHGSFTPGGSGTKDDPYVFSIDDGTYVNSDASGSECNLYLRVQVDANNYNTTYLELDSNGKREDCSKSNSSSKKFMKTYHCKCDHPGSNISIWCEGKSN